MIVGLANWTLRTSPKVTTVLNNSSDLMRVAYYYFISLIIGTYRVFVNSHHKLLELVEGTE